ncbi:MAG: gamma carbonic anhydrase family protein [Rhodospirillaceae bacterium]|nr:gamma carbonic anhydrase family protein [Rhodospirillaceae bacterium]|tara:strand:- start:2716 stop:3273 length:558 start_codon:yes stop_codon:yes gene_type:complete
MLSPLKPYLGVKPTIASNVFIADTAAVIGNVNIGADSSVWYNCVIRGDAGSSITIGERVNIQDGTVIHINGAREDGSPHMPVVIGDDITIGHSALIHACTLQSECFIGMRSVVLDGAVVETGAMVAAGAVVSPGKTVKSGELWAGIPAKPLRDLRQDELDYWPESVSTYCELASNHIKSGNSINK